VGQARPPAGSPEERPPLDRPASTDTERIDTRSATPEGPFAETGKLQPEEEKQRPDGRGRHRKEKKEERRGFFGFLRELPGLILIAFVLALLIKTFLIQAFFIPSASMVPTLRIGDRVLVNKVVYAIGEPQRADVIVFVNPDLDEPDQGPLAALWNWLIEGLGFSSNPNKDFIKRVIGLPGETVEVRKGRVFIDGERIKEPYARDEQDPSNYGPVTVPPESFFVMGDNRRNSQDSRSQLGFIPEDKIVGKAFILLWPPSRVEWLSDD
jgi:signal peptidase I